MLSRVANFSCTKEASTAQLVPTLDKDCFGKMPKPARYKRALPRHHRVSQTHVHSLGSSSPHARRPRASASPPGLITAKTVEPEPDIKAAPTSGCLRNQLFNSARNTNFSKTGRSRSFTKVLPSDSWYPIPGNSFDLSHRPYADAVGTPNSGLSRRSRNFFGKGSAITSSPRPLQIAAEPKIKKGTSEPSASAIFASASRGRLVSKSSFNANRVDAASLLPPPRPAPCGIFFCRLIDRPPLEWVDSKKSFAARITRFSSPFGTVGSSQIKSIQRGCRPISISSHNETGAMKVSIS